MSDALARFRRMQSDMNALSLEVDGACEELIVAIVERNCEIKRLQEELAQARKLSEPIADERNQDWD